MRSVLHTDRAECDSLAPYRHPSLAHWLVQPLDKRSNVDRNHGGGLSADEPLGHGYPVKISPWSTFRSSDLSLRGRAKEAGWAHNPASHDVAGSIPVPRYHFPSDLQAVLGVCEWPVSRPGPAGVDLEVTRDPLPARSSKEERSPYKRAVGGPSPPRPTVSLDRTSDGTGL